MVFVMDCSKSSVLLESKESLLGSAKDTSGVLTGDFTFLKEKGLGKSNGNPKREVVFALGNSSTGGTTGMTGDGGESAGWVSFVSGGWGIFICRSPWSDKLSFLILPCSDETRVGFKRPLLR